MGMGFLHKKDLGPAPLLSVDGTRSSAAVPLQRVFAYTMKSAEEAVHGYIGAKNVNRFYARPFSVLSILLGAAVALLPMLVSFSPGTATRRAKIKSFR